MGDSPTFVDRSASESAPFLQEAFDTTQRAQLQNLVDFGQPEIFTPDTAQINTDLRDAVALANLRNQQFEQEQDPELAAARDDFQSQVLGLLDFDQQLQDEFLKMGIEQSLAAGQPITGEAGTADTAILQNVFGRNFLNQLMQNLAFVGNFLNANPEQQVTLAPGTETEIQQDALANAIQSRNLSNERLLSGGQTAGAGALDFGLNINEALTREGGNLANVKNQTGGGFFDTLAPVAGSLIGTAFGPVGTAVGGALGKGVSGLFGGGGPASAPAPDVTGAFSNKGIGNSMVNSLNKFKF